MDHTPFTPLAAILVTGYLETRSYSRQFQDQHESPPTILSKSHHLRSVVQAEIQKADGWHLSGWYAEFGRVEVTDLATMERYLLKSESSLSVGQRVRQRDALFDANVYLRAEASILVYDFARDGVTLWLAGAVKSPTSERLYASGIPSVIHTWPYNTGQPDPFDQNVGEDAFEDLGGLDMDTQDEGQG